MNITEAKKIDTAKCLADIKLAQAKLNIVLSLAEKSGLRPGFQPGGVSRPEGGVSDPEGKLSQGNLAVPCLIKDNITTLDFPTTCASKILKDFHSPFDATAVTKLKAAGAFVAGKTNLDEFAMGSSTENSAFGSTKNPVDMSRVPGGSSGGSAAAVAAGVVPFALGSDTAGSVRQPAAFCGVVGLKPTYGRVSRYGLVAMASSLDTIGPIASTVEDCALVLQIMAGKDNNDATSLDAPVPDYVSEIKKDVKKIKLGLPEEYFGEGVDQAVTDSVRLAVEELKDLGAEIIDIQLPHTPAALPTYYIIQPAETSANLARYDGVKYGFSVGGDDSIETIAEMYQKTREVGFGPEVKRRIMLGTYVTSAGFRDAYYDRARKVATLVKQDFDRVFDKSQPDYVDVIITPTTPTTAFKLGEKINNPLSMYMSDLLTVPANIAGIPAISIPCGMVDGLPMGLQIMGPQLSESLIMQVAYAFEQATLNAPWREELLLKQQSWR